MSWVFKKFILVARRVVRMGVTTKKEVELDESYNNATERHSLLLEFVAET